MSKKHRGHIKGDPVTYQAPLPAGGVQLETFIPWTLVKRGCKKQVITPLDAPQEFLPDAVLEKVMRRPWRNGWCDQIRMLAPAAEHP